MGHSRPRHNPAREEQRLQRNRRRDAVDQPNAGTAEIIMPKTTEEKAEEKRLKQLQQEIEAGQTKMSSKKKKRLDSYINKKLKQERRADLFKSLAASQDTLTSSLQLRPSSSLGSKQFLTNQDKLDKVSSLSDRKRARVYDQVATKKRGYHSDTSEEGLDEREAVIDEGREHEPPVAGPSRLPMQDEAPTKQGTSDANRSSSMPTSSTQVPVSNTVGSALVRGPDGEVVKPTIRQRQRKVPRRIVDKSIKPHLRNLGLGDDQDMLDASDSSFDSSDSAFDTSSGEDEGENGIDDERGTDESEDADDRDTGESSSTPSASEDEFEDEAEEWLGIQDADEGTDEPKANGIDTPALDSASEGDSDEVDDDEEEDEDEDSDDIAGESDAEGAHSEAERGGRRGKRKRLGDEFKQWANDQLGIVTRTEEGEPILPTPPISKKQRTQEGPLRGPLGEDLVIPQGSLLETSQAVATGSSASSAKAKRAIVVERPDDVQEKRLELPILAEEDTIMEAIRAHAVVVICGETGSGKTTQVPQFLYEAGFGSQGTDNPGIIGVTQPRRVAAMSMATRVGDELALPPSKVSYQIRYDATTSSTTSIKFMTDGVLLRELANDFLLKRYSVIIVDEAHERSVNTDVLIGTLTRVVKLREELLKEGKAGAKPLRMIIMSATLRVTDFTQNKTLFKIPPPVISVGARQHPVTLHFNRKTRPDYMQEAYSKVSKIHARLPSGGILVFLTGQQEIVTLCKRLEKRFGKAAIQDRVAKRESIGMRKKGKKSSKGKAEVDDGEAQAQNGGKIPDLTARQGAVEAEDIDFGGRDDALATDVDDGLDTELDPEALDSDEEYDDDPDALHFEREEESDTPMHILPLYSLLATDKQMRVFQPPPEGHRLVIVATNVAETSLTIPGIRYVVDCGMAKERTYDQASNIQSFDVSWISKASASQRAGRAGRTGPGHCYRLYSSNVFETLFAQHSVPEILRMPIEGIVLQMKSMNIDQVTNFPFPTPPDRAGLQRAEKVLVNLGALNAPSISGNRITHPARITELGQAMSLFPLSPRFSKMLVTGQQHGCLPYVIAVVSALSVGDPFLRAEAIGLGPEEDVNDDDAESKQKKQDDFDALTADGSGAELAHIRNEDIKAREVRKLARRAYYKSQQVHAALGKAASDVFKMLSVVGAYEYDGGSAAFCEQNYVRPKAMQEIHKLRAQITNIVQSNYPGLGVDFDPRLRPPNDTQLKVIRQLLTAAFTDQVAIRSDLVNTSAPDYTKYISTRGVAYRAVGVEEDVFIHPSSILFHNAPPEAVVYQELIRTSLPYIRTITKINTAWLPTLGKPLCTFSRVLETAPSSSSSSVLGGAISNTAKGGTNITTKRAGAGAGAGNGTDPEERECFVVPKFAGFENLQLPPVKARQRRVGSRWVFV